MIKILPGITTKVIGKILLGILVGLVVRECVRDMYWGKVLLSGDLYFRYGDAVSQWLAMAAGILTACWIGWQGSWMTGALYWAATYIHLFVIVWTRGIPLTFLDRPRWWMWTIGLFLVYPLIAWGIGKFRLSRVDPAALKNESDSTLRVSAIGWAQLRLMLAQGTHTDILTATIMSLLFAPAWALPYAVAYWGISRRYSA